MVTGVFLLTVVLSGISLLYEPDLQKLLHPSLYDATPAAQVGVDRYSGRAEITSGDPSIDRRVSQVLWESWNFSIHAGTPISGALRVPWLLFGFVPLLLAVTGMTTWLMRRRKRRAKAPAPAG